jgi:hypothetical protein
MTPKEKIALLQDFVEYCENALDISNLPKITCTVLVGTEMEKET